MVSDERQESVRNSLTASFLKELKEIYPSYPEWLHDDLSTIIGHPTIQSLLHDAFIETAVRHYINKHGFEHGITVARNMLHLFRLIDSGVATSDYIHEFPPPQKDPRRKLEKEHILFTLLVASYIHDVGRFYDPSLDHRALISDALEIINGLRQPPAQTILLQVRPDVAGEMIRRIKELCLCHDEKEKVSGKVEIALIKLADALDCGKSRVYTEVQKPELDIEHTDKVKTILYKDKHPEKYFGSSAIFDPISTEWKSAEGLIEITMSIENYASAVPLKVILNILEMLKEGPESVKELSKRILVRVTEKVVKVIGDRDFILYPKKIGEILSLPYAKLEILDDGSFLIREEPI